MLQGGIRHDVVRSFFRTADEADDLLAVLGGLEADARSLLTAEGVAESDMVLDAAADLRYAGQEYSLRVVLPPSRSVPELVAAFHEAYRERYGHASPAEAVQFVALRVAGSVAFARQAAPARPAATGTGLAVPEQPSVATARFDGRELETAIVRRSAMTAQPVAGPALIYEETATTVVPPGWLATTAPGGHLVLDKIGDL
jgi:N-methylhydantoinase A